MDFIKKREVKATYSRSGSITARDFQGIGGGNIVFLYLSVAGRLTGSVSGGCRPSARRSWLGFVVDFSPHISGGRPFLYRTYLYLT